MTMIIPYVCMEFKEEIIILIFLYLSSQAGFSIQMTLMIMLLVG